MSVVMTNKQYPGRANVPEEKVRTWEAKGWKKLQEDNQKTTTEKSNQRNGK